MVNIWLFSIFQSYAWWTFSTKVKMLLFFMWHIPLQFFREKLRAANTLYAKLSPVSTRGHQSQLGHMTEWGR